MGNAWALCVNWLPGETEVSTFKFLTENIINTSDSLQAEKQFQVLVGK